MTIPATNSPKIYLDSANKAAITAYSTGGNVTVDVNVDLPSTLNSGQAGIVAYTTSAGGDSTVNIGSAGTDVDINGLVYSYGNNIGYITLGANAGTVNGALVAGGTNGIVDLNDKTLEWDERSFLDATNTDTEIYQGFSGGRRVYLPVLGSWRQE